MTGLLAEEDRSRSPVRAAREVAAALAGVASILAAGAAWSLWDMLPFPDTSTIVALLISVSLSFISAMMWRAGASRADSSSVVGRCAFWGFAASATAVLLLLMVLVGEIPDARPWLRAAVALAAPVFACLAAAKRVTLTWFGVSLALFSVLLWTAVVVLHQHNWLSPYPQ